MRMVLPIIAAAALMGGAAPAKDDPNAIASGKDAAAQQPAKMLYVCDEDERSWRAFSRDLGVPEFVTAEQVRADTSKAWAQPKCITAAQLRRLNKLEMAAKTAPAK